MHDWREFFHRLNNIEHHDTQQHSNIFKGHEVAKKKQLFHTFRLMITMEYITTLLWNTTIFPFIVSADKILICYLISS